VNKALEAQRNEGKIGAPLEAKVTLFCDDALLAKLQKLEDELRFVLITSGAIAKPMTDAPAEALATDLENLKLSVEPLTYEKCVRCWHRREDVGSNPQHPELCSRCVINVAGEGEKRLYA
jgi:isoleucyl-tRNA synthetase